MPNFSLLIFSSNFLMFEYFILYYSFLFFFYFSSIFYLFYNFNVHDLNIFSFKLFCSFCFFSDNSIVFFHPDFCLYISFFYYLLYQPFLFFPEVFFYRFISFYIIFFFPCICIYLYIIESKYKDMAKHTYTLLIFSLFKG